ncbi:type IA DNA topoisomerase [Chryseobacterium cucumeris]|uniref:DNA topoisomerase n=1 Tax=Chryseobacterium cucumeris TaxID=1813611 RepID=A0ABX9X9C6_9FLAO|nr:MULTISPECIES: type IA DNA topoisomerase [Chryseobacterium]RKE81688.1 DNA topoisomerase-3 [Chryseobacterium sp. AG363]ROH94884.1 type IA DNA topoisomerase [Chryseobacterium cucumeris]
MKAVLAEKPSVAREIAMVLGATEKKDGYLTGNGYAVTWAFGHLITLGMPEDYGISACKKQTLPILPDPFKLTIRKVRKDKQLITDPGVSKQLKIIEKLFTSCSSIIVATDSGREGELIFRYIYEYLNCTLPFERLWISSLTEKAIRHGFQNLKPGHLYDGLFHAAHYRNRADWLLDINTTQALTIAADDGLYSLGRVQTPTLALLCKRYREYKEFTSQQYWQIELMHQKDFVEFKSLGVLKFSDKKQAEDFVKSLERNRTIATVSAITSHPITEQAPLLFDLTGLQKEANKRFSFSAERTLDIAQSLYEKKFITYPLTGSQYISEDLWPDIPDLIRVLQEWEPYKTAASIIPWGNFNKSIVEDANVTHHHGLLTTEKIPSALTSEEKVIYDLIAFRLFEAVSPPCVKEITEISLQVLHYDFTAKGQKILQTGWRHINGNFSEGIEEIRQFPELKEGMDLKIKMFAVLEKKTLPPSLYTEESLLSAMENAGKDVEETEQRKILKNIGIGTPATRASIIETLIHRDYIKRENRSLISTDKGLKVYDLVKDKKIADVSLTAEWELEMQCIENNECNAFEFQKQIENYTTSVTKELLQIHIEQPHIPKIICPKCKTQHLVIHDHIVKCSDTRCNWLLFRNICGIQISLNDIESLVNTRKTSLIKGMKSKSGKIFNAHIILNDKAEISFEFEKSQ